MKIKNSWADITLQEYYAMLDIYNSITLNELEQEIALVELLTGKALNEDLPYSHLQDLLNNYKFIQEAPPTDQYIDTYYTIGGQKFKMCKNPSDLTIRHFQDFDTLCKSNSLDYKQLHILSAIMFVPVGKEYGTYDIDEMCEFMLKNMTIDIANNLVVFFSRYVNYVINYYMDILSKESKKTLKTKKTLTPQQRTAMENLINFMD